MIKRISVSGQLLFPICIIWQRRKKLEITKLWSHTKDLPQLANWRTEKLRTNGKEVTRDHADTVRCVANLANMVSKVTALHSKGKLFPLRQMLTCANYGIYVATCQLCGEQYVGQTSNKFSKCWNSQRSSWNAVNLSDDQEQVPLLQHVVHEHKIEKSLKSVNVV